MTMLTRRLALLAKIETTSGTDSVPVGASDTMLPRSLTLTPITQETADRSLLRTFLGGSQQLPVAEYAEVEFEVELAGAGTSATTIPRWSRLLLACGYSGAANSTTSYRHLPASSNLPTITLYVFVGDTVRHRITGAMGTYTIDVTAKGIPVIRFRFVGAYTSPTDTASSGVSYTGWQVPVGVRDTTIPTLTLHSIAKTAQPIRSITIDGGNQIVPRALIGGVSTIIQDRAVTGTIEVEYRPVATRAWMDTILNVTTGALTLQVGTAAFNIVDITAPAVQLTNPRIGSVDGIEMLTMDMRFLPVNGNDEIQIDTR